jgi:hypothetical protein
VAAAEQHKRIFVEVGGDWCIWCKILDGFFAEQKDVRELRDRYFVLMKVNRSPYNENYAFLSQFPKIPGYPYLFVLDADGKLIVAKETGSLEQGTGYSAKNVTDFLNSVKASNRRVVYVCHIRQMAALVPGVCPVPQYSMPVRKVPLITSCGSVTI